MKASECPVPANPVPYKVYPQGEWLVLDSCPLSRGEKWLDSFLVTFPVPVEYNGGTLYEGVHYRGYKVPSPVPPEGFYLKGIGIGHQMNSHPPFATMLLVKEDDK